MKNILRAQWYQIRQDWLLWLMFLGMTALSLMEMLNYIVFSEQELSGSYFGANMEGILTYSTVFILLAGGYVMGRDYTDKTVNYDLLYGHSRTDVFWGRAIPTLCVTLTGGILLLLLIPGCTWILFGWGNHIAATRYLFRVMLYLVLMIRLTCELILLTVAVKKVFIVYAVSTFFYLTGVVMRIFAKNPFVFSYTAGMEIFDFRSFSVQHIDGTGEIFYEKTLPADTVVIFLISSVGISVLCLLLARHFIKTDDMD